MGLGQVEGRQGVGRGVVSLLRLWKCVEKGEKKVGSEWWVVSRKRRTNRQPTPDSDSIGAERTWVCRDLPEELWGMKH